jgi:Skp family chaperone for outer membrane proteins
MSTHNPNEIWQIEVSGQIYEAPFGELGDWIGEGSLQPQDKVRKGNLRWIEAKRVPSLVPFFNAKENGLPMPVVVSTTDAAPEPPAEAETTNDAMPPEQPLGAQNTSPGPFFAPVPEPIEHSIAVPAEPQASLRDPDFCAVHPDLATVYLCDGCGTGFCKACPKAFGGSVRLCPFCGEMSRTLSEIVQQRTETTKHISAVNEGFGAADFFNALSHPFKYKVSLFFGALMFMALSLGQSVSALGGIYMMTSAIFCVLFANMLTFGILANTIENFTHGDLEANFMPDFENFDLWDDVVHPFFLSIGAYISSFGPFVAVMLIGFYMVVSSVSSQMDSFQQNVEKIPGTHYYDAQRTVDQSEKVKDVLGNLKDEQAARVEELEEFDEPVATGEIEDQSRRESREQEELWEMAQQSRRQSLESAIGKSPETQAKESEAMLQGFLGLAAPLVVIGAIFFLWGAFYFPAACAVAGYTRSFTATINPLVGLDTIRRLGGTYVKILLMGLVLVLASTIVGGIAGAILSPFDLPGMGNLPAKAIGALFGFFLWVVFSCILGYAIFKKSDELQIT